jgi:hypothetical protein
MQMHGSMGTSDKFKIQGSQNRNGKDEFTHPHKDIGIIKSISIDSYTADKWKPYSIKILRGAKFGDDSTADGYSEFIIDEWIGNEAKTFSASTIKEPITISPEGDVIENNERITIVQFDHNPGQKSQTIMKYKETWGSVDRVLISTEKTTQIGVDTSVKYKSPEIPKIGGSVEVGVNVSWSNEITRIRQDETQKINQREFDWSFEADPKAFVFRLQVFIIPYADQIYKDSKGNSYAIRKLRSEIVPAHVGDFLFIPRMDEGKVDPIPMSELENDWLRHMDPENVQWIKERHLDKWLTKGWVIYDNQVPVSPVEIKALVITDALNIREDHDPKARILGHLKEGDEVAVVDTWTEGNNIWVKLKPDTHLTNPAVQWSAMLIGKNRYIKLIDDFANFPE